MMEFDAKAIQNSIEDKYAKMTFVSEKCINWESKFSEYTITVKISETWESICYGESPRGGTRLSIFLLLKSFT